MLWIWKKFKLYFCKLSSHSAHLPSVNKKVNKSPRALFKSGSKYLHQNSAKNLYPAKLTWE